MTGNALPPSPKNYREFSETFMAKVQLTKYLTVLIVPI